MQRMFLIMTLLAAMTGGPAWAQTADDSPGKSFAQQTDLSKKPAEQAAATRLEEAPEAVVVPVFVMGTVNVKDSTVFIKVKSARETNGAGLKDLIGKSLQVTGKKIQRLEQMTGKDVELQGSVTDFAKFDVLSYSERRTVTAAESPQVQGARGPVGWDHGAINAKGPSELPSASGNRTPIGALNDPKGAGKLKPNTGALGTLQGRKKAPPADFTPDPNLPAIAALGALR